MPKDCADFGLAGCGLEFASFQTFATSDPLDRSAHWQIRIRCDGCRRRHPREIREPSFRQISGPRNPSPERLAQLRMLGNAFLRSEA
eukprot:406577-Alexandrium_andersonii.AAC.1